MMTPLPTMAGNGAGLEGLKAPAIRRMPVMAVSADANSCQVGVPSISSPQWWGDAADDKDACRQSLGQATMRPPGFEPGLEACPEILGGLCPTARLRPLVSQ